MAFGSSRLSRRGFLALGATSVAGSLVAYGAKRREPAITLPPLSPDAKHVVIVSIDGMQPKNYLDPDARGLKIPTLRKLRDLGSHAVGAKSVWPTLTYPSHATIVTGVDPITHGILNNYEFDPYGKLGGAWMWKASEIHSPALWNAAKQAGLRVGASYWPITVGADIDYLFPQIWDKKTDADDILLRSLTKPPEMADEIIAAGGELPAEHRTDRERTDGAVHIIRTRRPELMFVYFADYDEKAHGDGPDSAEALAQLESIDSDLARVVSAVEEVGALAATTFVIVSDHGFANVKRLVRPNILLKRAGLVDVDSHGNVKGYRAIVRPAGGLAGVILADQGDTQTLQKVTDLFAAESKDPASAIVGTLTGDDVHARGGFPDASLILEAAPDAYFGSAATGPVVIGSPNRGSHGFSPDRPEMLASTILSGRGVKQGAVAGVISLRDIAPTIAKLLGCQIPSATGRILDELLV